MTTSVSEFLKLGGCEVLEVRREGRVEVIEGRVVKAEAPSCPHCGRERMWRHGKRKRRISHAPYDDTRVDLLVTFDRWRCPDCGRTYTPELAVAARRARLSNALKDFIAGIIRAMRGCVASVAKWVHVSWGAVWRVLERARPWIPANVKDLCIDEVFFRQPHKFFTILSDADGARVVAVASGRGYKAAKDALSQLPADVRRLVDTLATDFCKGHKTAAYEMLQGVTVVADRFHLQRLAREAVRAASKEDRERALVCVRELKAILRQGGPEAVKALSEWVRAFSREKGELASLVALVDDWQPEIWAYLLTRCSNGVAEAINRKISLLRRNACGYTNPANFIRRILLLNPPLHPES